MNKTDNLPTQKVSKHEPLKLNHIDLLRGVAVIMVVITHVVIFDTHVSEYVRNKLMFGQNGVQLFFFLSAYTLCLSMNARKEDNYIRNFYIRRFFRIAPLYYLGIIVYFIVWKIDILNQGGPLKYYSSFTKTNIALNGLFVNSFYKKGYNHIVPGGWSISTEMLFYLIFPFIFKVYHKVKSTAGYILIPVGALVIANVYMVLAVMKYGQQVYTEHFYYAFIANQLPVFTVGISFYFLDQAGLIKIPKAACIVGFLVLFCASYQLSEHLKTNINLPIFVVSLSYCFLFTYFKDSQFNWSLLRRIGQLSFSIYVFHFLFAYPLTSKISALIGTSVNGYVVFVMDLIITLILSTLVAVLSEKFIEKPGITIGKKLIKWLASKDPEQVAA